MSDEEFNRLFGEITAGLPLTMVVNRLALLVRALVESGGAPAADLVRAIVTFRELDPQTGPTGHPTGDHLQGLRP